MPCYFPFKVDNPHYRAGDLSTNPKVPVPCGKCPYCLQRRANNWVFRCMQHLKDSDTALWVTLTYEQPPLTTQGTMTVRKRDYQLFMKRLRKLSGRQDIKYYACAEYGDTFDRPHYHAVIFNVLADQVISSWEQHSDRTIHRGRPYSIVNGIVHVDEVNRNTIMYTAKYMNKGKRIPAFDGDLRHKEFQLFSKGLGINYLTPQKISYHLANPTKLYSYQDGFKVPLPRYFRTKIFGDDQKDLRELQAAFAQNISNETYNEQYQEYLIFKSPGQTFEQFRYARKELAINEFRKSLKKRCKFK